MGQHASEFAKLGSDGNGRKHQVKGLFIATIGFLETQVDLVWKLFSNNLVDDFDREFCRLTGTE